MSNTIMSRSLGQSGEDWKVIGTIGGSKSIITVAIDIFFPVTVPAPIGVRKYSEDSSNTIPVPKATESKVFGGV